MERVADMAAAAVRHLSTVAESSKDRGEGGGKEGGREGGRKGRREVSRLGRME